MKPDLEIDESPRLHIRAWRLQPYFWVLAYLFVLAGLFGDFGKGWLSQFRMRMAGVDEGYVLEAARMAQGLGKMEEIRYAVPQKNGTISIIPRMRNQG